METNNGCIYKEVRNDSFFCKYRNKFVNSVDCHFCSNYHIATQAWKTKP